MHSLTIVFGPNGTTLQFLFKERASAEKMLLASKSPNDVVIIEDDFDQHAEIRSMSISGVILESLASSGDAVIERSIQNHKTQVKGQNKAANDPMLKFSMANGGAPMNHPGAPRRMA